MPKPRILVVGAGPAGLSAAETLLDRSRGAVDVEIRTLEPYLGGNASSFTTPDGRVVEQGLHCFFGYYKEMAALLARAGVDIGKTSSSGQGHLRVWEPRDRRTHDLYLGANAPRTLFSGLSYSGMTLGEKVATALFFARVFPEVARPIPERLDDLCFTAFCLERGLPASLAGTSLWRIHREAEFNMPGEVSAFVILHAIKMLGRDFTTSEYSFPMGSMSELWWEPVAARVASLGGRLTRLEELRGMRHDGRRLTSLRFRKLAAPPTTGFMEAPFEVTEDRWTMDFDAAIFTISAETFQGMFREDRALMRLPGFAAIARMGSVSPMGLHVWHREAVRSGPRTLITGLPCPLGTAMDVKPFHPSYRNDARFGAVLHFVGPETDSEDVPDERLLEEALAAIRRVDGYEGFTRGGVLDYALVRNHTPHRRYWNTEPGSLRFKPQPHEALENLWLAGDWVRGDCEFPCMETAIRSGRAAALDLLGWLGAGGLDSRRAGR
jgi:hypothetical protein